MAAWAARLTRLPPSAPASIPCAWHWLLGLATLLAGLLVLLFWQQQIAGWALVALGGSALLLALWRQGRRVQRTVYRRQTWTGRDGLVLLAAAITVGVYALPSSRGSLAWSPYPQISLPGVDPVIVLATLGLLTPAVLLARRQGRPQTAGPQPSRRFDRPV